MRNDPSIRIVVLILVLALPTLPALADTIHVPSDQPTIQAGIDVSLDGDLVLVSPGTYVENVDFLGKAITLLGLKNATVIDGNQEGSAVTFSSGESEASLIEGFTIRNGDNSEGGGGIVCWNSCPTISDCTVINNFAGVNGGGIYFNNHSDAMIVNCTIFENIAYSAGGGISCWDNSSPMITGCAIYGNEATLNGGGIHCDYSSPTITGCTISGNIDYEHHGGGIFCYHSTPTITNCSITGNSCVYGSSGGILCHYSSSTITNCTIADNSAAGSGGGLRAYRASPIITNCIFWGNTASTGSELDVGDATPSITYCDVQGAWPGTGNMDADPLFVGGGNYHLTVLSPCIDSGTDAGVYKDIDGEIRPLGPGIDIGADEYTNPDCWDVDMDGYGDPACGGYDCDDTDPAVNPEAREGIPGDPTCSDGIDNDCDGFVDTDPECIAILVPDDHGTIQGAIDVAQEGNTVLVAQGIYRESISLLGKEITVKSVAGPIKTILDGGRAGSTVIFTSGETEVAVLDGFTIQNGSGTFITLPYLGAGFYAGGGIFCEGTAPTITNCMITNNYAYLGGGLYLRNSSPTLTNCMIVRNRATGLIHGGGGIYLEDSSPTITNCTVGSNYAGQYGGGIFCWNSSPSITNSILWGDFSIYDPEIHVRSGSPVVTYSDVEGGWSGVGNIEANPSFAGGVTYHLRPGSPCVDSGTDAGVYTDMDGQRRPWGAGFDMGADEFSTEPCSLIASSGNQFIAFYLLPVLAFIFFSRRFLRR